METDDMPKKQDKIDFEVVSHFSGSKTIKDLLKSLVMREVTDDTSENKTEINNTVK